VRVGPAVAARVVSGPETRGPDRPERDCVEVLDLSAITQFPTILGNYATVDSVKQWRGIATRYDRTAKSYQAAATLASPPMRV
jgi:hypothetical protein